jgi:protein-S-isoprenylcysteine O-methyltransferase Ste14
MRDSIRKDLLSFVLPAIFIYAAGFGICAWDLVRRQGTLFTLSMHSIVGLALIVIGLTLTFVAASTLRRFYSPTLRVRRDHQLITHGMYRFVRHPFYTGMGVATVGVLVYASSLYGLLILLTLIPLLVNRIRIEEQMMTAEFGDSYRFYARGTKKLIPFVY